MPAFEAFIVRIANTSRRGVINYSVNGPRSDGDDIYDVFFDVQPPPPTRISLPYFF